MECTGPISNITLQEIKDYLPYHEELKKAEHVLGNQENMKDQCGMH